MNGRVLLGVRQRQRKSRGRSSLVNPNMPNAGARSAPELTGYCVISRHYKALYAPIVPMGKRRAELAAWNNVRVKQPPGLTRNDNCAPGTIRESSVGSDGKHCCGGEWPRRFHLLSAEILCKSGCRSSPFYGSFLRGTRPVQVRGLPPRPDDRIDRSVKNRQKAAFVLQREAGARSCCSELVYKRCAQQPCNE